MRFQKFFLPLRRFRFLAVGGAARVAFDAYPTAVFPAKIVRVDPAETVVSGVPTYKAVFVFLKADQRIRSGLTATVDIVADDRSGALAVPQRAVSTRGRDAFVSVVGSDGVTSERRVGVGLRDVLGYVEILEGLAEGERVVAR